MAADADLHRRMDAAAVPGDDRLPDRLDLVGARRRRPPGCASSPTVVTDVEVLRDPRSGAADRGRTAGAGRAGSSSVTRGDPARSFRRDPMRASARIRARRVGCQARREGRDGSREDERSGEELPEQVDAEEARSDGREGGPGGRHPQRGGVRRRADTTGSTHATPTRSSGALEDREPAARRVLVVCADGERSAEVAGAAARRRRSTRPASTGGFEAWTGEHLPTAPDARRGVRGTAGEDSRSGRVEGRPGGRRGRGRGRRRRGRRRGERRGRVPTKTRAAERGRAAERQLVRARAPASAACSSAVLCAARSS